MFFRDIINTMIVSVVSENIVKVFPKNYPDTTVYMNSSSVSAYMETVNKNAEKLGYVIAWEK